MLVLGIILFLELLKFEELTRSVALIFVHFTIFLLGKELVSLFGLPHKSHSLVFLGLKLVGVATLLMHLLLSLGCFVVLGLLLFVKEALALNFSVFLFLHFIELLQLLFFFEGLLGLFLDVFADQKAFLLISLVTPLGSHLLVLEHFIFLGSITLFVIFQLLLALL